MTNGRRTASSKKRARRHALRMAEQGAPCWWCGEGFDLSLQWPDPLALSADHIRKVCDGGTSVKENIRPMHIECNEMTGRPTLLADAFVAAKSRTSTC